MMILDIALESEITEEKMDHLTTLQNLKNLN